VLKTAWFVIKIEEYAIYTVNHASDPIAKLLIEALEEARREPGQRRFVEYARNRGKSIQAVNELLRRNHRSPARPEALAVSAMERVVALIGSSGEVDLAVVY
jgi:hypothetical protein